MRRPRRGLAPEPGTRPPEYVIELRASDQLKNRIRRISATPAGPEQAQPPGRAPEQELEAEP